MRLAERDRDERQVRVVVDHVPQQPLVGPEVEVEEVVVDAVERVAERGREVLLVPEQHVDGLDEAGVDLGARARCRPRTPTARGGS